MYYTKYPGTTRSMGVKVLCGDNEAKEAFEEAHLSSGHRGQKATREAMSLRFYWPGMSKDINLWVSMLLHFPYTLLVSKILPFF